MAHPILDRIDTLRRTARRLALLRALGLTLTLSLLAALVMMWVDSILRWEDLVARLVFTTGWIVCTVAGIWIWPRPLLRVSWSTHAVARMLEQRFPELADRLTSAVAFVTQKDDDPYLGSPPLMRNLITETAATMEALPIRDALDWRPIRRSLGYLGGTIVLFLVAGTVADDGRQAISRLITPWRPNPWPRVNHLRFVDPPERLAIGSDLTFVLVDERNRLPDTVELLLQFHDDEDHIESIPMVREGERMVVSRSNIRTPFSFRAMGGDDDTMPWSTVQVVPPPVVVTGSTELRAPAYTRWRPRIGSELPTALHVLEGTAVYLAGSADKPLSAVELHVREGSGASVRYAGSVDGNHFRLPLENESWIAGESGDYLLSLFAKDGTNTVGEERWSVQVLPDAAPLVAWTLEDAPEWITNRAVITLQAHAQDDLGIRRIELHYGRSDSSGTPAAPTTLMEGPAQPQEVDTPSDLPGSRDDQVVHHAWSVESNQFEVGTQLTYHVLAEDYKGQTGQTDSRRLLVVSELELLDLVARQHSGLLHQLQSHLNGLQQARARTEVAHSLVSDAKANQTAVTDEVQAAVMNQRQVNRGVGMESGVLGSVELLTRVLDRSRIGTTDVRVQLEKTQQRLQQVHAQHLEPALRDVTEALHSMQARPEAAVAPTNVTQLLGSASSEQQKAELALAELLDELSAWDHYQRFAQDLSAILREQETLTRETRRAAAAILQDPDELAHATLLKTTAARQLDLARRTATTLATMKAMQEKLRSDQPDSATSLDDAGRIAERNALSGGMREAGKLVASQKFGLAREEQQAVQETLARMLQAMGRRPRRDEDRLDELRKHDGTLARLQEQQAMLADELKQGRDSESAMSQVSDGLNGLSQEMEDVRRSLSRLDAAQAASLAGAAANDAQSAAEAAQRREAATARQRTQQTGEHIADTRDAIQREMQAASEESAQREAAQLAGAIRALIPEQQAVVDGLQGQELDSRAARQMVDQQEKVLTSTRSLEPRIAQLPAFALAIRESRRPMQDTINWLTGPPTVVPRARRTAERALGELQMILGCLSSTSNSEDSTPGNQPPDGNGGGNQQNQAPVPQLAQLRMIRALQWKLNQETSAWSQSEDRSAARADVDKALTRLAEQQRQIGALLAELLVPRQQD